MWWRDERLRVEHAGVEHREHPVHVADHVGVAGPQGERLDPHDAHVHLHALGVDADCGHGARLAGQAAGQVERVGVAHGVDGGVHAAALGGLLHGGARVVLGQVDRLGAERLGEREPVRHAVDGDHPGHAGRLGGLHGAQADGPEPEHGRGVAGPQPGLVDRVPARAHHVAGEQGHVVGHALRDAAQREVRVRHEHLLRLRALEARRASCRARTRVPRRTCGSRRGGRRSTGRRRSRSSPSTRSPSATWVTPSPAATTVPTNSWPSVKPCSIGHAAVVDVEVRAAHARGLDADDRVVALDQLGLGPLLDRHLAGRLECHSLHRRRTV